MDEQLSFFSSQHSSTASPDGLQYRPEFIAPELEQELIARISALPLQPFQFGQFEGHRRVTWFGFSYDYQSQRLVEATPIPDWLSDVIADVEAFGGAGTKIEQVLCTEYDVGVGIGWHRDKPHFERIFGMSLGSSCKFRFRRLRRDNAKETTTKAWERFTLDAAPRSLYAMSGEARDAWEHSIPGVEQRRQSITFRTMR